MLRRDEHARQSQSGSAELCDGLMGLVRIAGVLALPDARHIYILRNLAQDSTRGVSSSEPLVVNQRHP